MTARVRRPRDGCARTGWCGRWSSISRSRPNTAVVLSQVTFADSMLLNALLTPYAATAPAAAISS
ncbi:hypothetical protein [Streptomyces mutabilis]|uniref:hypothetical protein n=1 Tax=Streptomyces mutabilis TaxID=67332 RepID=UPI0034DF6B9C